MARQLVEIAVESKTDITMQAMRYPTTLFTLNHRCIATTVLEENDLFATFQCLSGLGKQQGGKGAVHHLAALQILNINNLYFRQFYSFVTFLQRHQTIFPCLRIIIGFEGRGRCTK